MSHNAIVRQEAGCDGCGVCVAACPQLVYAPASRGEPPRLAHPERCFGCLACEEYRDYLIDHYEGVMERHGFATVEIQGAPIVACHAAGHGHAPGIESLQKAFQGLVEIAGAFREDCGRVSCSGPYGSYGAGLARLFDSISQVAEEHPLPLPDIHVGRLFADMSRLYFRRSHSFLLPKEMIINTVGLVPESSPGATYAGANDYPWYLYHDGPGWRYAVLSAIAALAPAAARPAAARS